MNPSKTILTATIITLEALSTPMLRADIGNASRSDSRPAAQFNIARKQFLDGDYDAAAVSLKKGAKMLEMSAKNLPASEAGAVKNAAANIYELARNVSLGRVTSIDKINDAVNKAGDLANGDINRSGAQEPLDPDKSGTPAMPPTGSGAVNSQNPRGSGSPK